MDITRRLRLDVARPTSHHNSNNLPTRPPIATGADEGKQERFRHWPFMVRMVMGHSMVPVLPPKTKVYAWRWFRRVKPGDVVIFEYEGRETIKRVERFELDRLFVLGDHVETSTDSRHFGAIPREMVEAKVIWPRAKKQPVYY